VRYLLTGGGTGGHVYPALAIKELLKQYDQTASFLYVGTAGKAEEYILGSLPAEEAVQVNYITARGLPRSKNVFKFIPFLKDLFVGTYTSFGIIKRFNPDVIIATGGYVSAPVVLAGYLRRRKIVIHEQNSVPGLVNKVLSRFADRIFVSFPETITFFPADKVSITGYPIRRKITRYNKSVVRKQLGIPSEALVVFIFGGSSGARLINEAVVSGLKTILNDERIALIHGTGRDIQNSIQSYSDTLHLVNALYLDSVLLNRYIIRDYFFDIDVIYSAADLVVSRAGAGTIMECAALGLPMIIIPKAGLPGDHQTKNARSVERAGGGVIIPEERKSGRTTLDSQRLAEAIIAILTDAPRLIEMGINIQKLYNPDDNEQIVKKITALFPN